MRTLGAGVREGFEVRECEDGDRGDCGADRTQGSRRLLLCEGRDYGHKHACHESDV